MGLLDKVRGRSKAKPSETKTVRYEGYVDRGSSYNLNSKVTLDGVDVTDDVICADACNGFVVLFARDENSTAKISRLALDGPLGGYLVKVVRFGKVVIEVTE